MILGIDPSLSATGIAAGPMPDGTTDHYTVRTEAGDPARLYTIHTAVTVQATCPDRCTLAVVEDLPTHAHGAGLTGMAQGVIRLALYDADVPYVTVPAATLKKFATGKGNATKADMRMAWYQRVGEDVRDDNQVDALWLHQIGLHLAGNPAAITLPKAQVEALTKLTIPEGLPA